MATEYQRDIAAVYQNALRHRDDLRAEEWLVPNAIPVVHFGDIDRYFISPRRIVTVGLNPSDREFTENRFGRDPSKISTPAELGDVLSAYFHTNPYSWFHGLEALIQHFGASFYDERSRGKTPTWWTPQKSTALHTDIASPLATRAKWSDLPDNRRAALRDPGFRLWRELIGVLQPDLILMSIAGEHLDQLNTTWRTFDPLAHRSSILRMKIGAFQNSYIVWTRAAQMPFGFMRYEDRPAIAAGVLLQPELGPLMTRWSERASKA